MAWYSRVPNSGDIYLALFNIKDNDQDVSIDFSSLGLKGNIQVRDLRKKQNIGIYNTYYTKAINKHGAVCYGLHRQTEL
ncbi:MAG: glycoside hydrolase family 27 protein [Mucilaginibacter sp.]|nr:glycoside hydrolase family 27 protein [Mucilaginibacter sp.]